VRNKFGISIICVFITTSSCSLNFSMTFWQKWLLLRQLALIASHAGNSLQKIWNVHASSRWPWHLTKSMHLQDCIFSTSYRNWKQGGRQTWGDYITNAINYDYLPHAQLRITKITMYSITITLKVITIAIVIAFVFKHLQNETKPICIVWWKIFRQHTNWLNATNEITNLWWLRAGKKKKHIVCMQQTTGVTRGLNQG